MSASPARWNTPTFSQSCLPTKWRPLNASERADAEDDNRRLLQRRESKKGDKQAQMSGYEDADPKKERTHWHFGTPGDRPSVHPSTGEDLITRSSLGNSPAKLVSQMLIHLAIAP